MNCRCRGRDFGIEEIGLVRSLIAEAPARSRAELSGLTCLEPAWRKAGMAQSRWLTKRNVCTGGLSQKRPMNKSSGASAHSVAVVPDARTTKAGFRIPKASKSKTYGFISW